MKTIWKYHVSEYRGDNVIAMPIGAQCLSVGSQNGELFMWALVDKSHRNEHRRIVVKGTGWEHDNIGGLGNFIGTVQQNGLVWHVFDRGAV